MHDAAEAFIGDMSGPLKTLLPDYKVVEERVERAIAAHFNLTYPWPAIVKEADLAILHHEKNELLDGHNQDWKIYGDVDFSKFNMERVKTIALGRSPEEARRLFTKMHEHETWERKERASAQPGS